MLTQEQQTILANAARFAPSADNSLPWQFEWAYSNALRLVNDPDLSGKATDKSFILTNLALGAAVENVVVKAQSLELSVLVKYRFDEAKGIEVILTFSPTELEDEIDPSAPVLAEEIEKRCTDRRYPYNGEVTDDDCQTLKNVITSSSTKVSIANDPNRIQKIIAFTEKAEAIRFKDPALHSEIFSTIKLDEEKPDSGMTPEVLNIHGSSKMMLNLVQHWSVMKWLNRLGANKQIAKESVRLPMRGCRTVACFTTRDTSPEAIFDCGRQIQRFWLMASNLSISLHPYAAPGVLTLANPSLSPPLQHQLQQVKKLMEQIFPADEQLVMLFRIGRHGGKPPRTGRRSLSALHV